LKVADGTALALTVAATMALPMVSMIVSS